MKLELGKFYRTRDGLKVQLYCLDAVGEYPVHGRTFDGGDHHPRGWTAEGDYQRMSPGTHAKDIVAEWKDTVTFDWSQVPKWANWIAQDGRDNAWFFYTDQPIRGDSRHLPRSSETGFGRLPATRSPKWGGDWKDSLTQRPK